MIGYSIKNDKKDNMQIITVDFLNA